MFGAARRRIGGLPVELSKKVAYLKGLMEGLKIDTETPEGQVLKVMSDILADIADAVEDNACAVDAIADYIDLLEDGADPLDEIDTYEYGSDPTIPDGEAEEAAADEEPAEEELSDGTESDEGEAAAAETEPETAEAPAQEDESIRFNELLENIMTNPDYTDSDLVDHNNLVETLKNMVVREYDEEEDSVPDEEKKPEGGQEAPEHTALDDEEREDFITRLESLLSSVAEDEVEEEEDDTFDSVIGRMNCPFCHHEIELKVSDIADKIVGCPFCGNKLTIML